MPKSKTRQIPLFLSADYSVIPRGTHEVYLYQEAGTSLHLQCAELDLPRACSALVVGTTVKDLEGFGAPNVERGAVRNAVEELLGALRQAGLLQREVAPQGFSDAELGYFRTHIAYFSRFETAEVSRFDMLRRVREAHVLLLGVGGLGTATLMYLVGGGVGRVTCVDPDVLKASNLGRQTFFGADRVGAKKVDAAKSEARRLSPFTEVVAVDQRVDSTRDIETLVAEHAPVTLIIQAADSPIWELTKQTARAALATGVPSLHSSYLGVGPLHIPGKTSCPACVLPNVESQIGNAQEIITFFQELDRQGPPRAVLPTSLGQFGIFMAHEALSFISGAPAPRTVNGLLRLFINGAASSRVDPLPSDPRCPVCHGVGGEATLARKVSTPRAERVAVG